MTQDRSSFQQLDLLMFRDQQLGGNGPCWIMFPPGRRSVTWSGKGVASQHIHVFSQTTAMLVALAAGITAQVTRFLGVALDQMRALAGTAVPVLVFLSDLFIVGVVFDDFLVMAAARAEVGVHAGSGTHGVRICSFGA